MSMINSTNTTYKRVRNELETHGYAFFSAADVDTNERFAVAAQSLVKSCARLPVDPHNHTGLRQRVYGTAIVHAWEGEIRFVPSKTDHTGRHYTEYWQEPSINPDAAGTRRTFAPLRAAQRNNPFLHHLILHDLACCSFPDDVLGGSVLAGVHIIKLIARPGEPALASPNMLHRDGEPFTFAHLLERSNVTGGENVIAGADQANRCVEDLPSGSVRDRRILKAPFDGFAVNDARVSHYVSPVKVVHGSPSGWRTVLLIDFSPMVPVRG